MSKRKTTNAASAITNIAELLDAAGLAADDVDSLDGADAGFPLRVPRGYASRFRQDDPDDPLLRQVLPLAQEALVREGDSTDPVGDLDSMRSPGLLQKYHGRALLVATGACAIHCRYCFRREFPYGDAGLTPRRVDEALRLVAEDKSISEVILSGGDPLSLSDERLNGLLLRIGRIDHVRRVRIHTRHPVALPTRVDTGLCEVLDSVRQPLAIVIHCNHANEIDRHVGDALSRLVECSTGLLNQSVLLRGVNDSAAVLAELSECLFDHGVLPYYLHQLDRVAGAAHFAVTDDEAIRIIEEMRRRLPGYLVPRLVRELPGAAAKQNLERNS